MRRCRTAARSAVRLADISTAAAGDGRPWRSAAVPAPVEGGLVFSGHVTQRSVAGDWNVNGGRLSEPGPPFWVHSTLRSRGDWCPHSARVAICRRWRAHPSLDDRLGPAGRTGPQLLRHLSAPDPAQSDDVVPGPSIGRCSVVCNAIRLHRSDVSCSTFSPIDGRQIANRFVTFGSSAGGRHRSSRQRSAGRLLPLPGPRDGAPGRSQHPSSASAVSRGGRICIFLDKVPSARGDSSCSAEVTCVHISFTCPSRLDRPFFRLRQHKQHVGGCQPATSEKVQVTCQPFGLDRSRFRGHPTAFHDGARRTGRWPPTDADRPSQLTTSR